MIKEELEKEAEEKYRNHKIMDFQGFYNHHYYYLGYVEGAESREKQIAKAKDIVKRLCYWHKYSHEPNEALWEEAEQFLKEVADD